MKTYPVIEWTDMAGLPTSVTSDTAEAHLRKWLFCYKNKGKSTFSNSLIIHEEKTKEFITTKEVWIYDLYNYHKLQ